MKIAKNTAVTISYTIAERTGQMLERSQAPIAYLHGGYGNTFAKVEEALEGQVAGFNTSIELQPQEAFGLRDERLVQTISKSQFPPGVKVGGQLEGHADDGSKQVFRVIKIKGDQVLLDANHPMAGKTLRFNVQVLSVRPALDEEVAHGHVHGAHGHHH